MGDLSKIARGCVVATRVSATIHTGMLCVSGMPPAAFPEDRHDPSIATCNCSDTEVGCDKKQYQAFLQLPRLAPTTGKAGNWLPQAGHCEELVHELEPQQQFTQQCIPPSVSHLQQFPIRSWALATLLVAAAIKRLTATSRAMRTHRVFVFTLVSPRRIDRTAP